MIRDPIDPPIWRVCLHDPDDALWRQLRRRVPDRDALRLDWEPGPAAPEHAHLVLRRDGDGLSLRDRTGDALWQGAAADTLDAERLLLCCRLADERRERTRLALELERLREQLRWEDAELGLPRRELLERHLRQALARARRLGIGVGLIELEFSRGPDLAVVLGPDRTDELRRLAIPVLRQRLGPSNSLAVHGRHGFLAMVTDLPPGVLGQQRLHALCESLHRGLAAPLLDGHRLGPVLGSALFPEHGEDASSLLRQAGAALCRARSNPQRPVRSARRVDLDRLSQDLADERCAARVLSSGSWRIVLQGQFPVAGGPPASAEVLVRCAELPTQRLIAALRRTGTLAQLGRRMRATLDDTASELRRALGAGFELSINLGPEELEPELIAELGSGSPLTLEVTEDGALDAEREAVLLALADAGHALAVDDFGTGNAALERLLRLPYRELKLDRSLLPAAGEDGRRRALTESALGLARALGMRAVLEGVEDRRQLEGLRLGAEDRIQGYAYGRPEAPDRFLARWRHDAARRRR